MSEFDSRTAIKTLAEMEWRCTHPKLLAWDAPEAARRCSDCGGTSRVVPFEELQVACPISRWGNCLHNKNDQCRGNGWIPQPDKEKACWRVFWLLPQPLRKQIVERVSRSKDPIRETLDTALEYGRNKVKEAQLG